MPQISLQEFGYAVSIYPILGYWFMSYEKKKDPMFIEEL